MLHEFILTFRDEIIERTRQRLQGRAWPTVSVEELEHGVPLFLTQLAETLRLESTPAPFPPNDIDQTATLHGADMLSQGYSVAQVVQDYGDICQAVTALAVEKASPITGEEFQTLNRCLDVAIAGAVTEHARMTRQNRQAEEVERLGHTAHEARDFLSTAFLALHSLKRGDRTGLGMGLSIARKAVRAHGGDIVIENKPGHGCIFKVCVPSTATARAV